MSFKKEYLDPTGERSKEEAKRDRFQIEFNAEERELWIQGALWLQHYQDATVLKQFAFFGMLSKIQPLKAEGYLREKLLINQRNNIRHNRDVKTEIENKFHLKNLKSGWKL